MIQEPLTRIQLTLLQPETTNQRSVFFVSANQRSVLIKSTNQRLVLLSQPIRSEYLPETCSNIPEETIHLGAGRGELVETPFYQSEKFNNQLKSPVLPSQLAQLQTGSVGSALVRFLSILVVVHLLGPCSIVLYKIFFLRILLPRTLFHSLSLTEYK